MHTLPRLFNHRIMTVATLIGMGASQGKAQVTSEVLWQRCLGGSDTDYGFRVQETSDSGYVCIGYGASTDGDLSASNGNDDLLVTKLDSQGVIEWTRALGGSEYERAFEVLVASDGSIVVLGTSTSSDGDVSTNLGLTDVWVVKLSPTGNTIWEHSYGGSDQDLAAQIHETSDGGFVIHAGTGSSDGDVVGFHTGTGFDNWIFKISAAGTLLWSRAIGGSEHEAGGRMMLTADGGCLLNCSATQSSDGDVPNYHGGGDCFLAKLSPLGVLEWSRAIGGSLADNGIETVELGNGDIMLLGATTSADGDIALNHGGNDVLLARLNSTGDLLWLRTYGGALGDGGYSIVPTSDGGFVIGSVSISNDGDVTGNHGDSESWVFKVDANGSLLWQRCLGGSLGESTDMKEDADGGYLLWGQTLSNDGDVSGNHGGNEIWLAKLSADGDLRWQRCLGGSGEDYIKCVIQSTTDTYVACGFVESNDGDVSGNYGGRDMWVVKLKVTEPIEPPECALFIPNAFSPNGSNTNDAQCLYGTACITSMSFNIYDRWGNKVFESTDPNACWDGTYKGQALDPAVFVYRLSATLNNGEYVQRSGNITLMR